MLHGERVVGFVLVDAEQVTPQVGQSLDSRLRDRCDFIEAMMRDLVNTQQMLVFDTVAPAMAKREAVVHSVAYERQHGTVDGSSMAQVVQPPQDKVADVVKMSIRRGDEARLARIQSHGYPRRGIARFLQGTDQAKRALVTQPSLTQAFRCELAELLIGLLAPGVDQERMDALAKHDVPIVAGAFRCVVIGQGHMHGVDQGQRIPERQGRACLAGPPSERIEQVANAPLGGIVVTASFAQIPGDVPGRMEEQLPEIKPVGAAEVDEAATMTTLERGLGKGLGVEGQHLASRLRRPSYELLAEQSVEADGRLTGLVQVEVLSPFRGVPQVAGGHAVIERSGPFVSQVGQGEGAFQGQPGFVLFKSRIKGIVAGRGSKDEGIVLDVGVEGTGGRDLLATVGSAIDTHGGQWASL